MPKGKTTPENTWQRIEYWVKKFPEKSLEECQEMLDKKIKEFKSARKNSIEYWVKKFPEKSLEECQEMLKAYNRENCFQCIEYWVKKFPEKSLEECQILLENAKKNYLEKRPDNHGENNPAHKTKVPLKIRQQRSPSSIEYWVKKFPEKSLEECQEMLKNHLKKLKSTHIPENTCTRIEYWLAKGFSEEEAKIKLKERQATNTLESCIKKYGEEEGFKKYNERQTKWSKSLREHFNNCGDGRNLQSNFAKKHNK